MKKIAIVMGHFGLKSGGVLSSVLNIVNFLLKENRIHIFAGKDDFKIPKKLSKQKNLKLTFFSIKHHGFLKVPNSFGSHKQNKQTKEYRGGNLQLIHGSKMFLCESTLNIIPEVGDFYFFPNYLMHTVFPFKDSNEERRSISFNAKIDDEIYNVY